MSGGARSVTDGGQIAALTSLRFIAAFAVLVLHYRELVWPMPGWVFRGIVGGQYGVTFFFVLSGFILTWRYHGWFADGVADGRYWRFQRFRLARIYPIYIVGLLLDTPWHLVERAGQMGDVGQTYWASWLLNLVGLQAWVPAVPFAMFWNTPAWSVSAEFFFYATFPFACAWLTKRARSTMRLGALLAAIVAGAIGVYFAVIWLVYVVFPLSSETQYILLVYNPLLRCGEFLGGCIAGQWFLRRRARAAAAAPLSGEDVARARRRRNLVIVACLLAVCGRIWMPDYTGPSQALWTLDYAVKYPIFILPFVALILTIASGPTFLSPLLERPWMVLLGESSYALYMIHWSVTSFLRLRWLGEWDTPWVHVAFLLATVGASVLCYRLIELPWRARLRGAREPAAGLVPALS
ncbi:MAG: acyltransferase family protein [Vitreoscilla sp.]